MPGDWGGARENSGAKGKDYVPTPEEANEKRERALHERVKREQREFNLERERGLWLRRADVQQAVATVVALMTQSMRSVPDNLERACSLTPQQAQAAQELIDNALAEMAAQFKAVAGAE